MATATSKTRLVLLAVAGAAIVALGYRQFEALADNRDLLKPYDFVEYWCAGRLLLDGRNPYDPDALVPMQRAMYDGVIKAIMMWNPPWALPLTLPFAALPWQVAQLLWIGMQLAAVLVSVDILWRIYGGPIRYRWVSWLMALTFAPTLFLLFMGQISGLMLLGLAGFLYFVRHDRLFLAGCAAALTALKPHHLSLFALVLVLEATRDRRMRQVILAGTAALIVAGLLPLLWNPDVWQQYREALRRPSSDTFESMEEFAQSTIGYRIREHLPGAPFVAMFIPVAIALIATTIYWRRSLLKPWPRELAMPLVVLISMMCTPYGAWAFDMVLLLLPLTQMAVWIIERGRLLLTIVATVLFLVLNGLTLMTIREVGSQSNPWIAPTVLVGYLVLAWDRRAAIRLR